MLSIIVPTMWRSEYLRSTMRLVEKMPDTELIIIDNDTQRRPEWAIESANIKYLKQVENIGVNPAWNLGVKEAKYGWILLMNDDIVVNLHTIYLNLSHNLIPETLWGLPNTIYHTALNETKFKLELAYPIGYRPLGFGQLMLMPKSQYYPIPNEMKVYIGDDIQWQHHFNIDNRPGVFTNLMVVGEESKTSGEISRWSLHHPDTKFFEQWHKENGFHWPFGHFPQN